MTAEAESSTSTGLRMRQGAKVARQRFQKAITRLRGWRRTRWILVNLIITAACNATALFVVWAIGSPGGADPIVPGNYLILLYVSPLFMWPVYMKIVATISRTHPDTFRRRAVAWCPVLATLPLGWFFFLFVVVPEVYANWLFFLLYGLTVRPLKPAPVDLTEIIQLGQQP